MSPAESDKSGLSFHGRGSVGVDISVDEILKN